MKHRASLLALTLAAACGEADPLAGVDPFGAYQDEHVTVIGGDTTVPIASGELGKKGCLQVTTSTCVPVKREGKYCKASTGPVDAILVGGMVAEVVCYADEGKKDPALVVDADGDGDIDIPQNANGSVITFDPSSDGKAVVGDVTLDANNVTLYGNGPDRSIIKGNLRITGNNARVRGIRVKGNVDIELNTAALILAVVEGNLTIRSNNTLVAETAVFGNVTVDGNNAILVGDGTQGNWRIDGSGASCERNYRFQDADSDKVVDPGERGDDLSCR